LDQGYSEAKFVHIAKSGGYYFAKLTQKSDLKYDIWTEPVWIDQGPNMLAENTDDPEKDQIIQVQDVMN
tara:strand:- start:2457 stop:2663 length:207 start_codon:yes stop_codon:yes gene_type:complete